MVRMHFGMLFDQASRLQEEFATKITRGVPDRGTRKSWPWFHAIDALCTVNCTARWGRPSMDRPAAPPAELYMT